MSQKILIIGGVALGPKAASRAIRLDPTAEITLIDQDSVISYGGCGIPYYVCGDVAEAEGLRSTSFHSLRDADYFAREKGFAVRTGTRALKIDRQKKQVLIKDVNSGREEILPYDKLVLATGSSPFTPPIPGVEADGIFTISDIHKAVAIKERLSQGRVGRAVVLGGGAIGLEMAEAMADLWGAETTVVEMMDQILPRLIDKNIALMAQRHLEEKGVAAYTSERATSFCVEDGKVTGVKTDKRTIAADLVILAVGVRPNSGLAREAGLAIGSFGGIVVNRRMQTSDPNIYAGGDCVEMPDLVAGGSTYAPMGSLANRQGRVIGSNLAGKPETFDGVVGSFIIKLFDNCVSKTGLSLEAAKSLGFDALAAFVVQADKAHFYPDSSMLYMQMVVEKGTQRVLGVQGIGPNNSSLLARIGAVAGILKYRPTVQDIANLEFPYAPPFAAAMDIINVLANTAQNILEGRNRVINQDEFMERFTNRGASNTLFVDVRAAAQGEPLMAKYGPHWLNIPNNELRQRLDELPADREIVLVCNAGSRSYDAMCMLQSSSKNTVNLQGGIGGLKRVGIIL
ncbi:MAG: FAD-dependent oxidoreductase [Desulfobulbaceae bacterium]|nr:FAD-dependent oxidoreductase [Desulfobulbaceae bacterium]